MKKIYTAVTLLVALAVTELYYKPVVDKAITGTKVIKQTPQANARIEKP